MKESTDIISFNGSWINIFLCLIVIFNSCKKDKSDPPVIEVFLPASGSMYQVGDTIHVVGKVHDDEGVNTLTCSLINGQFQPVLPVQSFPGNATEKSINFYYVIDNTDISSGNYRLMIFASDGESDVRKYQDVIIQEMPRRLLQVYLSAGNNNNSTQIYRSDSVMVPALLMSLPGDFSGATAITKNEQFYCAGKFTGDLNAINATTGSVEWSLLNCAVSGSPCFTGLSGDKKGIYVSYHDGRIVGYNEVKNQQFLALTDQGSFPSISHSIENRLLAVETFIFGGATSLVIYNNPGGIPLFVIPITMDIKAMITRKSGEAYIIGNENGSGRIYVCDIKTGVPNLRQQLLGFEIYDAAGIDEYFVVLATGSGLVEFDYNSNSLIPLVTGSTARMVKYEDADNEIYAAGGNELIIYGYQLHSLIQLNNYQLPDSIMDIDFLYNRDKFE